MDFFHCLSIFCFFGFKHNQYEISILRVIQLLSGFLFEIFPLDCILNPFMDNLHTIYMNALIYSLMPFFLILVLSICFNLIHSKEKYEFFYLICYFTVFLLKPSILQAVLELFKCVKISENNYYLYNQFNIECYTLSYFLWSLLIAIPTLLLYQIIVPGISIFILAKQKKLSFYTEENINKKLEILFYGYKHSLNYWQNIQNARLLLLILIAIYVDNLNTKTILSLILFGLFLLLNRNFQPLITQNLNEFEIKGTLILMLLLIIKAISWNEDSIILDVFSTIVTFACIFYFFFKLVKLLFFTIQQKLKGTITSSKSKIFSKLSQTIKTKEINEDLTEYGEAQLVSPFKTPLSRAFTSKSPFFSSNNQAAIRDEYDNPNELLDVIYIDNAKLFEVLNNQNKPTLFKKKSLKKIEEVKEEINDNSKQKKSLKEIEFTNKKEKNQENLNTENTIDIKWTYFFRKIEKNHEDLKLEITKKIMEFENDFNYEEYDLKQKEIKKINFELCNKSGNIILDLKIKAKSRSESNICNINWFLKLLNIKRSYLIQ